MRREADPRIGWPALRLVGPGARSKHGAGSQPRRHATAAPLEAARPASRLAPIRVSNDFYRALSAIHDVLVPRCGTDPSHARGRASQQARADLTEDRLETGMRLPRHRLRLGRHALHAAEHYGVTRRRDLVEATGRAGEKRAPRRGWRARGGSRPGLPRRRRTARRTQSARSACSSRGDCGSGGVLRACSSSCQKGAGS